MGLAAYVWPMLLLLWGWNRVRCQPVAFAVHRSVGLLLMAILISVATGLPAYSPHTAYALGGVLGTQISLEFLIPYLGRLGSAVLLSALFVVAVILTPGLNWRLLAWMGVGLVAVGRWLGRLRLPRLARPKSKAAKRRGDEGVGATRLDARVEDAVPRKPMVEEAVVAEPRVQEPAHVERRKRKKKKEPAVEDSAAPAPARTKRAGRASPQAGRGSLRDPKS